MSISIPRASQPLVREQLIDQRAVAAADVQHPRARTRSSRRSAADRPAGSWRRTEPDRANSCKSNPAASKQGQGALPPGPSPRASPWNPSVGSVRVGGVSGPGWGCARRVGLGGSRALKAPCFRPNPPASRSPTPDPRHPPHARNPIERGPGDLFPGGGPGGSAPWPCLLAARPGHSAACTAQPARKPASVRWKSGSSSRNASWPLSDGDLDEAHVRAGAVQRARDGAALGGREQPVGAEARPAGTASSCRGTRRPGRRRGRPPRSK